MSQKNKIVKWFPQQYYYKYFKKCFPFLNCQYNLAFKKSFVNSKLPKNWILQKKMSPKFGAKCTAMEVVQGHNLTGRNYIVTGASSGIGVETARALAQVGGRVILAVRDIVKGEEVAKDIRTATKNNQVELEKLELDNLASVNAFVNRFLATKRPLHCLINNAGIALVPLGYTVDGFETTFGTNHMGHFALTVGLLPALKAAYNQTGKKSRVVNVSSLLHVTSDIIFDDINYRKREYDPNTSYGQSKTANCLFSVHLTELYSKEGVVSNMLTPGLVRTGLQKHVAEEQVKQWFAPDSPFKDMIQTTEEGASTSVWAAVADELDGLGGLYLRKCGIGKQAKDVSDAWKNDADSGDYLEYAVNKEHAAKLWEISTEWLKNPPK